MPCSPPAPVSEIAPEEASSCDANDNVVKRGASCCCCCPCPCPPPPPPTPACEPEESYCATLAREIISKCECPAPAPNCEPASADLKTTPREADGNLANCTATSEESSTIIIDGPVDAAAEQTNNSGNCKSTCFSAQDNSCDVPPLFYDGEVYLTPNEGRCSCK